MRTHGKRPKDSAADRYQCAACTGVFDPHTRRRIHIAGVDYCIKCKPIRSRTKPISKTGIDGICANCHLSLDGNGMKSPKTGQLVHSGGCPKKFRQRQRRTR